MNRGAAVEFGWLGGGGAKSGGVRRTPNASHGRGRGTHALAKISHWAQAGARSSLRYWRAPRNAHIHAPRNRFDGERRPSPEARRDSKLGRTALAPPPQISRFPTEGPDSSAEIRSALASVVLRPNSPEWCSPSLPNAGTGQSCVAPVPKGRLNPPSAGGAPFGLAVGRPCGTWGPMTAKPSVETLGYSRLSLRDKDHRPRQSDFRKALGQTPNVFGASPEGFRGRLDAVQTLRGSGRHRAFGFQSCRLCFLHTQ